MHGYAGCVAQQCFLETANVVQTQVDFASLYTDPVESSKFRIEWTMDFSNVQIHIPNLAMFSELSIFYCLSTPG